MADWSPSQNAYPVRWECRNGRYASAYGFIDREVSADGRRVTYVATTAGGQKIGTYDNGDSAAMAAWMTHLGRARLPAEQAPLSPSEGPRHASASEVERD